MPFARSRLLASAALLFALATPALAQLEGSSPEQERQSFQVPAGFEVELVLAEFEGAGKFVGVAFDTANRLWTMTALEYPVDANEAPEVSRRLFASGGRDKVLVIDQPLTDPPGQARVFADSLAIPLGVLSYGDGAFVQYGTEIRHYSDSDGDGHADSHETILEGFGVQDSHLFPHQFTRVPGGRILMAQGLFNASQVRRPDGQPFDDGRTEIPFLHCKLASFSPDGSRFEPLTAGPNNIWGLTISRLGETWLQEANDLGYPIIPYAPGNLYATGSADRLKPYQPLMPPTLSPPQMGGTGLSGLAVADDRDGWPYPWGAADGKTPPEYSFYVANPITGSIQRISARFEGTRYIYAKEPDFLTTEDKRFRPVACSFGPDGCLYVVDWYNPIISHNEVPRDHPERDKTTGRIWRIRHRDQQAGADAVVLAAVPDERLIDHLGAPNARIADLAWQEIVDRGLTSQLPRLRAIAADHSADAAKRLGAVWAAEGLNGLTSDLIRTLARDENRHLRHEAARIASHALGEAEFRDVVGTLVDDPAPQVRAAVGDALRRIKASELETVLLMMRLGRGPLAGEDAWATYDREFERYLARWAMEENPELIAAALASPAAATLPVENRILASLSLPAPRGALALASVIGRLERPIQREEVRVLAESAGVPEVAAALVGAATDPISREVTLQHLLQLGTSLDTDVVGQAVAVAVERLWAEDASPNDRRLTLAVAAAFELRSMGDAITAYASSPDTPRDLRLAALQSLRQIGSSSAEPLLKMIDNAEEDAELRKVVLAVLAASNSDASAEAIADLLPDLGYADREAALALMSGNRSGARAILARAIAGDLDVDVIPLPALQQMRELLGDEPDMEELWSGIADRLHHVLRLDGRENSTAGRFEVDGPFTVEAWVQFMPGIDNRDALFGGPEVDTNFYEGRVRVYRKGMGDVAIAQSVATPDAWTHYALSRDADNLFRIYVNGELDATGTTPVQGPLKDLSVGRSQTPGGTDARFAEVRIWNIARTAEQIREDFDRSFVGEASTAPGLQQMSAANSWGELRGGARIEPVWEIPDLLTAQRAEERAAKFNRYRELASRPGDAQAGSAVFAKRCMVCHPVGGQGGKVGPPLDGVGLTGTEAILRNILTPNAAMEGGYRNFRVLTEEGRVVQGLLVSRDDRSVVLRQPELADVQIPAAEIERAEFTRTSIMPEGLFEAMSEQEVIDLMAYLRTLKGR